MVKIFNAINSFIGALWSNGMSRILIGTSNQISDSIISIVLCTMFSSFFTPFVYICVGLALSEAEFRHSPYLSFTSNIPIKAINNVY